MHKLSNRKTKLNRKPWITPEILKIMRKRDKLFAKFCKVKNTELKHDYHASYKALRNQAIFLQRKSKKIYYESQFQKHKHNLYKTWRTIKSITVVKTSSQTSIKILDHEGNLSCNTDTICNIFNNYFSNIDAKIANSIPTSEKSFHS